MNRQLLQNIQVLVSDGVAILKDDPSDKETAARNAFYHRLELYIEFHNKLGDLIIKKYAADKRFHEMLKGIPVLIFEDYSIFNSYLRGMGMSPAERENEKIYLAELKQHLGRSLITFRNFVEAEAKG